MIATIRCNEIDEGVVFTKMQDTVISDNEWKVVLDFNMIEIRYELKPIKPMCREIGLVINSSAWYEDFNFEFKRLQHGIPQYETDISNLLKLLPSAQRRKEDTLLSGYLVYLAVMI